MQPAHRLVLRGTITAVTAAVLLSGCADTDPTQSGPTSSPPPSAEPTDPTGQALALEFDYQQPQSPCPQASELPSLPSPGTYELIDPYFEELDHRLLEICTYQRTDVVDNNHDILLDEHVQISAQINLYRAWEDSEHHGLYPPLPIDSPASAAWAPAMLSSTNQGVWREGCGLGTPCSDGEDPTIQTHAHRSVFAAHAGNLEFYVTITYIAEELPPDVEMHNISIFRDLVLAAMEGRQRVD